MPVGTKEALLNRAEFLLRSNGYAAFSFADLADSVGVRKATIHHHFPTKEELGKTLVEGYIERFRTTLKETEEATANPLERLHRYAEIFQSGAEKGLLPLCGSLAAEMAVLPEPIQQLTRGFFALQLDWLEMNLELARKQKLIEEGPPLKSYAFMLLCSLEGASFINWATGPLQPPKVGFDYILKTLERAQRDRPARKTKKA